MPIFPVAQAIPFNNATDGYTAIQVQAAIEEAGTGAHITDYEAVDATTATTTSAAAVLLTSMTLSPAAGRYFASFSTSVQTAGTANIITCGIYVAGTIVSGTSRTIQPYDGGALAAANASGAVAITKIVTVTAGQTVTIEWATAGGTGTCFSRTLTLLRVG